ncbi:MAG: TldD/PmbA family protein [Deltaproteobacteria bacterium]|nr:TldD/PmbA family protein [Deltaproteobacteria bacterium]
MSTSKEEQELLGAARTAMALAKKLGASDAAAFASKSRDVETTWRDGKLEKISEATSRSISLNLFAEGRYGSMSTSDLRPEAIQGFVENAVSMVKALAKDPHRKLPDPSLYAGRSDADLEIFDTKIPELTTDMRLARAKAMEEGARAAKGAERINSVTASVSDSEAQMARVASNGFEGTYRSTVISSEAEVSVKDADGRRPEDWVSASVRHASDLPDAHVLGREATERAIARLGAKKVGSGTMTILVEARAARTLLRHLIGPMSGGALQQKESFFEGQIGKTVGSGAFTLTDEPLLKRGLGSRPFDGEGIACKPRMLIEKGVLKTYFVDVYYGSKLGMPATTGRTSNLVVAPGKKPLDALLKDLKDGIFVTSFLGGNSNSTTGVFSLGISGFRVVNGEKKEPIAEMNISGKHLDFWKRLVATGNDPYVYSSTRSPSLVFDGVSVAGK